MMLPVKSILAAAAGLAGVTLPCSLCVGTIAAATERAAARPAAMVAAPTPDTATVRLHISGMTCGGCATTARLAFKRLSGVYSATVTLDDSLGVIRYDPARLTPTQIIAHLTKLTGYRATVLPNDQAPRKPEGE